MTSIAKPRLSDGNPSDNVIHAAFRALLPAQILATAASSLGSMVNGLLVGNYLSEISLAALGFVTPLVAILSTVSTVVSGGARIVSGKSMGRGDIEQQRRVYNSSVSSLAIAGIVFSVLAFVLNRPIAMLAGAVGETIEPTARYVRGLSIGIIPTLLVPALMVFLQLRNDSGFALFATVLLAGLTLVFGLINLSVLQGGMFGMGLSVTLSQWVVFAVIVLRFRVREPSREKRVRLTRGDLLRMLYLGLPTALSALLYALRNSVLNNIAQSFFGSEAVASLAILTSAGGVFDAVNVGVGTVCLTLCALYYGMHDREGMKAVIRTTLRSGLILAMAKVVFLMLFASPLAAIFGAQGSLRDSSASLLRLYSLCMPLNIIMLCFVSAHQCMGRIKLVSIFYVFNAVLLPLGFARFFVRVIGVYSIYLCYSVAEIISIGLFYVIGYVMGGRSLAIQDMIALPENEGKYLNFSVRTPEEVVRVSERIMAYCAENGVDERRSNFCGLCVEEIACNAVGHGFMHSLRKKHLSVDIFLSIFHGNIELRVIDNCAKFNPLERLAADSGDDPAKNIGIRIVRALADEFTYQTTFGQNFVGIDWKAPEKTAD